MNEKLNAIKETSESTARRVGEIDRNIDETRRELEGKIEAARQDIKADIKNSSEAVERSIDRVVSLMSRNPKP
jgi:F0F1-type ATP synthase membrane subunit b/b'